MPGVGVEPTDPFEAPILSRLRIPFRHPGADALLLSATTRLVYESSRREGPGSRLVAARAWVDTTPASRPLRAFYLPLGVYG
jgi:hypothetical protein